MSEGFEMDAAHIKNSECYADKNIATGVFMLHKDVLDLQNKLQSSCTVCRSGCRFPWFSLL